MLKKEYISESRLIADLQMKHYIESSHSYIVILYLLPKPPTGSFLQNPILTLPNLTIIPRKIQAQIK